MDSLLRITSQPFEVRAHINNIQEFSVAQKKA
jgi:hypothetical protein